MSNSNNSDDSNIPVWVPPGQHDRPKPGSPEPPRQGEHSGSHGGGTGSADPSLGGGFVGQGRVVPSQPPVAGGSPGSEDPRYRWGGGAVGQGHGVSSQPHAGGPGGQAGGSQPQAGGGAPGSSAVVGTNKRAKTIFWVTAGILGSVTVLYLTYLGFMWFLEWAALRVPASWEIELGRSASKSFLSQHRICGDRDLNLFVDEMSRRLQEGLDEKPYEFRIKVLHNEQVNAFALPGGYVFVFSGLIQKAESGEEVAGVLAHEMQHVVQRHSIKRIVRSLGLVVLLRMMFGDVGGFVDLAAESAAKLGSLKYDREQEHEADMEAVKQLYRAGLDPRGLPRFFERLAEIEAKMSSVEKTLLPLLSTHPPSKERQRRLKGYIKKRGLPENMRLLEGFDEVKDRCGPIRMSDPDADPPGMKKDNEKNAL